MSREIKNFIDLAECERISGICIDTLRKAARSGRLRTTRVAGPLGPHLVLPVDLEDFRVEYVQNTKHRYIGNSHD